MFFTNLYFKGGSGSEIFDFQLEESDPELIISDPEHRSLPCVVLRSEEYYSGGYYANPEDAYSYTAHAQHVLSTSPYHNGEESRGSAGQIYRKDACTPQAETEDVIIGGHFR